MVNNEDINIAKKKALASVPLLNRGDRLDYYELGVNQFLACIVDQFNQRQQDEARKKEEEGDQVESDESKSE